ncbi:MAG TPA: hypothetical protein PKA06_11995 [Gemmatales bacterium]|nr:hypothetical protein [Gemmatales bacterium]HMP16538.1 hypothetical protein [Gemmatales bacterium]
MAETIPLGDIAHSRSGDKGNHANIAVIAFQPQGYNWLLQHLTAATVAEYFQALGATRVERFEAPNVWGLNFMLYDALAGGASRSLRIDTQGKALGQAILQMPVLKPQNLSEMQAKPAKY